MAASEVGEVGIRHGHIIYEAHRKKTRLQMHHCELLHLMGGLGTRGGLGRAAAALVFGGEEIEGFERLETRRDGETDVSPLWMITFHGT